MWKQKHLISGNDSMGHDVTLIPHFYFYHIYVLEWAEPSQAEPNWTIPLLSLGILYTIHVSVCVLSTIFSIIIFFHSPFEKSIRYLLRFFLSVGAVGVVAFIFHSFCKTFCLEMLWTDRVGSRHLLHRKICCWINNKAKKITTTFSDAKLQSGKGARAG